MKNTCGIIISLFLIIFSSTLSYTQSSKIDSINLNHTEYYPLYKIINILQLERSYDIYTGKILIKDKGRYLSFFIDDDLVYYEMQTLRIKNPPVRNDGIIYIPQEMADLITQWKRSEFQFSYVKNDFKIEKKEEVIYKEKKNSEETIARVSGYKENPEGTGTSANRIRVIILDPGHGGIDPGAIGQKGLREKDVIIQTCLFLKDYLKEKTKGINIVMLRDTDVFMSLQDRAKLANKQVNKNTAGLFLSIHANASYNRKVKGTETFVLSPVATDDEARAVAAMENGIIDKETENSGLSKILSGMISCENIRESTQMANFIQQSYEKNLNVKGTTPTGIKKALFYVLRDTIMPSALTEIGFLTNLEEEKFLRRTDYQKKVAISIGEGVIRYINWYNANNGFIQ